MKEGIQLSSDKTPSLSQKNRGIVHSYLRVTLLASHRKEQVTFHMCTDLGGQFEVKPTHVYATKTMATTLSFDGCGG